ncbi:MAG: hypothetical protein Q7U68_07660 [Candidatus Roizmanbacteria bacterium]|nr:hypothetical protein [Candidatus Roizmanbacteria bacterium]
MPSIAETQYSRIIFEEAGRPRLEGQAGEPANVIERFKGKIQYYNQVLNVHLTVESNPQVQDIAISDGIIQVNPVTAGGIKNEDFLLLHESAHDKQRALLGFKTTEALINSFTQDLTTSEIGARDWVEKYTMPPFVVSSEAEPIIFDYYSGELRTSLARGIRDVHSDVIALRNRKNIYLTDQEREDGIDSEQKFLSQFQDELTANIPRYDYRLVQDTEPDFIRKIARFRAAAGGADQILGDNYSVIAMNYDKYMRKTFGEESPQYKVYTALSQAYQIYFVNCTQRTELIDPQQMIAALDSVNPLLRARTADFLGELGDVGAMEHLTQRFLVEKNLDVKSLIGDAIIETMENNRDNEGCNQGVDRLLSFLLPRLRKFDLEDRWTQADIMAYIGTLQPRYTLNILDRLLSDITPYVEKGVHPFIDVAFSDKNGPIKQQGFYYEYPQITACVVHMIGLIGQAYPDEALKILIPWIKNTYDIEYLLDGAIHWHVAAEVARIGAVHKEKSINALNPLLHSDDDFKKRWATFALEIIQGKGGGYIAELPYELFTKSSIYGTSFQMFREFLRENIRGEFEES